ncbi:MAG TPA: 4Fe-4S binding protein [Methylophilaceae bacterium]|nr:4Fe-4S binding protein [Methylophilaceae bacterium]
MSSLMPNIEPSIELSAATAAALQAAQQMPDADPVPAINYVSQGRLLIIGPLAQSLPWAKLLSDTLQVELLTADVDQPAAASFVIHRGQVHSLHGWLGAFEAVWSQGQSTYDLVLDLSPVALFQMHLPPQGYFRVADDAMSAAYVAKELVQAIGEFEKPKYFAYDEKLCAHSRSKQQGCNKCIDICSTQAISGFGDKVKVEPHLCMGCGACASVCPSGAMRYNYPSVAYLGEKVRIMLAAYVQHGDKRPTLLIHNEAAGQELFAANGYDSLPDTMVPLTVHQVPSVGLDLLFYAIAAGAERVVVAVPPNEAPQYITALREQMALGETILQGLGFTGTHFLLTPQNEITDVTAQLQAMPEVLMPAEVAAFKPFNEKRTTLEFCINYFVKYSPAVPEQIALPAGAPFGNVMVDQAACTLCMSCVSACPAAALRDTPGQPMLKFVERNCVQCGLCEQTCPENAISLVPRLLLTSGVTQVRTLHEDSPFHCISCGKVFGTTRMIENMAAKLSGHSMFATPEAKRRLKMCGDCRVIDMMAPQAGTSDIGAS